MDWTGEVKRKPRVLRGADSPTTLIHGLIGKVIQNKRPSTYKPQIRFSKLPVCGLLFAQELLKGSEKQSFSSEWFTNIGTSIHDVFQTHFPLTEDVSQYVFGDWHCSQCQKVTVQHSVTPSGMICPKCRSNHPTLKYHELEVDYKGIHGHIDLVLFVDNKYYMIDFKSCSQAIVESPSNLPYKKNVMQIESYCKALQHQFGIDIYYYCLVYVSRDSTDLDNTFSSTKKRHHFCGALVTPKMLRAREKQLDNAVSTKRLVKKYLNEPTKTNLRLLDAARPCHTVRDYENPQTGMKHGFVGRDCRYLDGCTNCGTLANGKAKLTRAARDLAELVGD